MKILKMIFSTLVLILAVDHPSSAQDVLSFHPLFLESDAILIPEVEGSWEISYFGSDTISFQRAGDNFYTVILSSKGTSSRFEGVFTRVGDHLLLDLFPIVPRDVGGQEYGRHLLPAHSCIRARLDRDSLHLGSLNYRWFYDNVISKNATKDYLLSDSRLILTMPTDVLRSFLAEHADEPGFFEDDLAVRRIQSHPEGSSMVARSALKTPQKYETEAVIDTSQWSCLPSFPYKDGWLGGDGGLSVSIGRSKTLWLFGDTFVGRENQTSRSGSTMVTTIGISTCRPDKVVDMQYYWGNMYTDRPEAFFQSRTDRYRFWQNDAFIYNNNLYVLMSKIGSKAGASPDDIFNWSILGITLAKVIDPSATPPDQWKIELFPWSHVLNAEMYDGGLIQDENYIYIFMLKDLWKNFLVRMPIDFVESPEGHMEYFSQDEIWKPGIDSADAKILFDDQLLGSVLYHAASKRWIMVYGPHFGGTSIYYRTAPEITGPWTDKRILYDCPELLQVDSLYEKDNFCYFARVHAQFMEKDSDKLLVTYTCNSKKLSKLIANMTINVPQVVILPVPQ